MKRRTELKTIESLIELFPVIEFPEYQREPDVWTRDQKQRLLDSILRDFDISSIYLLERPGEGIECIDGRQRLNAILSFYGQNFADPRDNGFPFKVENEISRELPHPFAAYAGRTYREIEDEDDQADILGSFRGYQVATVYLSGEAEQDEFNLQFLRLNLGTLINAGEKLNAMVGNMRDLIFEPGGLGRHPFLSSIRIPTRRFARELTVAQILIQAFSLQEDDQFTRARHFDLQRFVKEKAEVEASDPVLVGIRATLDALDAAAAERTLATDLRSRAMAISVVLFAWRLDLVGSNQVDDFADFIVEFLRHLSWQVGRMRAYNPDPHYDYLVEFQRHLTQAAVERPAVTRRHDTLQASWDVWLSHHMLIGDEGYVAEHGHLPGEDQ